MVVAGGLPPTRTAPVNSAFGLVDIVEVVITLFIIIITIIIDFRRPNGEALENFPPAEGRPVVGVRGGGSPPATTIHYYNNTLQHFFTTIFTTRPKAEFTGGVRGGGSPPATNDFPPAEGRPAGGIRGSAPGTTIHYYN